MRLLTVPQVADRLALGQVTVWELIRTGELPSVKIGRSRRIPEDVLEKFVAERLTAGNAA